MRQDRSGRSVVRIVAAAGTATYNHATLMSLMPGMRLGPFEIQAPLGAGPDGQRFLMVEDTEGATPVTQINVVVNWVEELKRLVLAN